MNPAIPPDTVVLLEEADSVVSRGDVLVFRKRGALVAHRMVFGLMKKYFFTKGDNRIFMDLFVITEGEIQGRVTGRRDGDSFIPVPGGSGGGWGVPLLRRLFLYFQFLFLSPVFISQIVFISWKGRYSRRPENTGLGGGLK